LYKPPQPAQQSLPAATTSTLPLVTVPTPPSLPPAQYLHPGTANTNPAIHLPMYSKEAATIAISLQGVINNNLESAQPTATVTTPLGTQIATPRTPQLPVASIPQQAAPTATQQQYTLPQSTP
jgi:hypothetical protein